MSGVGGKREEKCWLHRAFSRRFSFFPDSLPLSHCLSLGRTGHSAVFVVHACTLYGGYSTTPNCTDLFISIHLGSQSDCGSDHEFLIAKFRIKLKKVGKTTRPFRYDLNQIPYDYTVKVTSRIQGIRSDRQSA